jgi:hypothetical protein
MTFPNHWKGQGENMESEAKEQRFQTLEVISTLLSKPLTLILFFNQTDWDS